VRGSFFHRIYIYNYYRRLCSIQEVDFSLSVAACVADDLPPPAPLTHFLEFTYTSIPQPLSLLLNPSKGAPQGRKVLSILQRKRC
jgi:hypothetical protein